jgi:hypothetical protein
LATQDFFLKCVAVDPGKQYAFLDDCSCLFIDDGKAAFPKERDDGRLADRRTAGDYEENSSNPALLTSR